MARILAVGLAVLLLASCSSPNQDPSPAPPSSGVAIDAEVEVSDLGPGPLRFFGAQDGLTPIIGGHGIIHAAQDAAQLFFLVDDREAPRGLTLAFRDGSGVQTTMVAGARSTAASLVFLTPGILSTDPTQAGAALEAITGLSTFPEAEAAVRAALTGTDLETMARSATVQDALKASVQEYLDLHPLGTSGRDLRPLGLLPYAASGGGLYVTRPTVGHEQVVTIENLGWRYVSVHRRDLKTGAVVEIDRAMGGAAPLSVANAMFGLVGAPTTRLDAGFDDVTEGDAEYWFEGPGLREGDVPIPAAIPLPWRPYLYSTVSYVVLPALSILSGSGIDPTAWHGCARLLADSLIEDARLGADTFGLLSAARDGDVFGTLAAATDLTYSLFGTTAELLTDTDFTCLGVKGGPTGELLHLRQLLKATGKVTGTANLLGFVYSFSLTPSSVRLFVPRLPGLSVAPTSVAFDWVEGQPPPSAQALAVVNSGGSADPISPLAEPDQAWIGAAVSLVDNVWQVSVWPDTTGLGPGTHDGSLLIRSPGATNSIVIPVRLSIAQGCTPACAGRNCGPDGCGGECGACAPGLTCNLAAQCVCIPSCVNRFCGGDGCGGTCGTCGDGFTCDPAGQCQLTCPTGRTPCDGACVDVQVDPAHCGGCGQVCGLPASCASGSCSITGEALIDFETAPSRVRACPDCDFTEDGFVFGKSLTDQWFAFGPDDPLTMGSSTLGVVGSAGVMFFRGDGQHFSLMSADFGEGLETGWTASCDAPRPNGDSLTIIGYRHDGRPASQSVVLDGVRGAPERVLLGPEFTDLDNVRIDTTCPSVQFDNLVLSATSCGDGEYLCGATCAKIDTDAANCGACGTTCRRDQHCAAGLCVSNAACYSVTDLSPLIPRALSSDGSIGGGILAQGAVWKDGSILRTFGVQVSTSGHASPVVGLNDDGDILQLEDLSSTDNGLHHYLYPVGGGAPITVPCLGVRVAHGPAVLCSSQVLTAVWDPVVGTRTIGRTGFSGTDLNNRGEAVGGSGANAYLWSGALTDLGPGKAEAINDLGEVVIDQTPVSDPWQVKVWAEGAFRGLIARTSGVTFYASDVNDQGTVVGRASVASGDYAYVFDGQVRNLNTLAAGAAGYTLFTASAINDAGWIIANGRDAGGTVHGFLLKPESACP